MARDLERAEARLQLAREARERFVLRLGEGHVVGALEFDADGEVVALLAPVPRRDARMPRAHLGRHVLDHGAVAANEVVRRHLHRRDPGEIRMRLRIEAPHEEVVDPRAAVFARRQRDVVDHDERDLLALGALVAMRRSADPVPGPLPLVSCPRGDPGEREISRCQGGRGGSGARGRGGRGAWGGRACWNEWARGAWGWPRGRPGWGEEKGWGGNPPASTCSERLWCVAEMMRTSIASSCVSPTRRTRFSWITRSNFTCIASGRSPTSSRKSVPFSAALR